jgi:hypothetical protein
VTDAFRGTAEGRNKMVQMRASATEKGAKLAQFRIITPLWPSENETVTSGNRVLQRLLSQEVRCKLRWPKICEYAAKR